MKGKISKEALSYWEGLPEKDSREIHKTFPFYIILMKRLGKHFSIEFKEIQKFYVPNSGLSVPISVPFLCIGFQL